MARDPRRDPEPGDRVLLRHEGVERLVLELRGGGVVWRWLGSQKQWTSSIYEWRQDLESARVTSYL